jgi:hypothetical protein
MGIVVPTMARKLEAEVMWRMIISVAGAPSVFASLTKGGLNGATKSLAIE